MPAVSQKQNALVHALANKGVAWAKRWVADSHGQDVKSLPVYKGRKSRRKRRVVSR